MKEFEVLYAEAVKAGREAVSKAEITPMTVRGSNGESWFVADGVCGFAWIVVKPGTSKFARWLKAKGLARPDSYYGGVNIWISDYNQSMQKKETFARAMAKVFSDAGIKAYSMSRMD